MKCLHGQPAWRDAFNEVTCFCPNYTDNDEYPNVSGDSNGK